MRAELTRYAVPGWGVGELWTGDGLVLAHDFDFRPGSGSGLGPDSVSPVDRWSGSRTPERLVRSFGALFAGEDVDLSDVPLDLSWCTPFQRAVAETLRVVPRGEVVSYAELAALAGYPNAHRAVGTFCARNRFLLLLPCHRVVGAGGIGGYGSAGVAVKRRLLALEGVIL